MPLSLILLAVTPRRHYLLMHTNVQVTPAAVFRTLPLLLLSRHCALFLLHDISLHADAADDISMPFRCGFAETFLCRLHWWVRRDAHCLIFIFTPPRPRVTKCRHRFCLIWLYYLCDATRVWFFGIRYVFVCWYYIAMLPFRHHCCYWYFHAEFFSLLCSSFFWALSLPPFVSIYFDDDAISPPHGWLRTIADWWDAAPPWLIRCFDDSDCWCRHAADAAATTPMPPIFSITIRFDDISRRIWYSSHWAFFRPYWDSLMIPYPPFLAHLIPDRWHLVFIYSSRPTPLFDEIINHLDSLFTDIDRCRHPPFSPRLQYLFHYAARLHLIHYRHQPSFAFIHPPSLFESLDIVTSLRFMLCFHRLLMFRHATFAAISLGFQLILHLLFRRCFHICCHFCCALYIYFTPRHVIIHFMPYDVSAADY